MDDSNQIPFSTLERYVAGDCSPADRVRVDQWLAEDRARAGVLGEIRRIGQGWQAQRPTFDAEAAWARVGPGVTGAEKSAATRTGPKTGRGERPLTPWAAGMRGMRPLCVVGGAIAATLVIALAWSAGRRSHSSQPFREFTTEAGNRSAVTLRDGTQLMLGPATRLRVPADFGRTERVVQLDGEAYFAVVHDATHPFAVRTTRATVRDIGTAFDVRAYGSDRDVRIAVVEGRVGFEPVGASSLTPSPSLPLGSASPRSLAAGDVAVVTDAAVEVARSANVAAMTAWTQGRFVFDETPLSEIVRELTRAFDLEIAVSDSSLLGSTITASFAGETDDQILTVVTQAIGAHYDRRGRRVVIRRGAAAAGRQPSPQLDPRPAQALSARDALTSP